MDLKSLKAKESMVSKTNIFFINHTNDFDYMAPLIYYSTDSVVIFLNVTNDLKKHPIYNYINKTHECHHLPLSIFTKIERFLPFFIIKKYLKSLNLKKINFILNIIKNLNGNNFAFYFEHGTNNLYRAIQDSVKKMRKISYVFYSVPHGSSSIENIMQSFDSRYIGDTKLTNKIQEAYNNYFKIVVDDNVQKNTMISIGLKREKLLLIKNLRYTQEWSDILYSKYQESFGYTYLNSEKKINILFLLTKLNANIFERELNRCLKILSSFDNLNIILKPHPRGLGEVKNINKKFSNIFFIDNRHITPVINDRISYVIAMPSSAIYQALMKSIPVVYPRYLSSSKLNEEISRLVTICETPDDFYKTVRRISKEEYDSSNSYPLKRNLNLNDWSFINE